MREPSASRDAAVALTMPSPGSSAAAVASAGGPSASLNRQFAHSPPTACPVRAASHCWQRGLWSMFTVKRFRAAGSMAGWSRLLAGHRPLTGLPAGFQGFGRTGSIRRGSSFLCGVYRKAGKNTRQIRYPFTEQSGLKFAAGSRSGFLKWTLSAATVREFLRRSRQARRRAVTFTGPDDPSNRRSRGRGPLDFAI